MTGSSPALAERPSPVTRSADWMVLGLAIVALMLGWLLRQQALYATETVQAGGLQLSVPAGSLPLGSNDTLGLLSPDGMAVRVNQLPLPPIGAEGGEGLVASRALKQAQAFDVYQAIGSQLADVAGIKAGILEYAYVTTGETNFFASELDIIHGYEALVPQGESLYVITLEAPESQWADVEALWPRLIESLRFSEVVQ
ncbi:MAG: hypothetical protein H0T73_17885 [Ardenticatenales bacterium]|nr:hypothetical protein [Ardenticatenales bacterium]